MKIDDRVVLDEAFQIGDISKDQYDSALIECDMIITELCSDVEKTEFMCSKILYYVNDRIDKGEEQIY